MPWAEQLSMLGTASWRTGALDVTGPLLLRTAEVAKVRFARHVQVLGAGAGQNAGEGARGETNGQAHM